MFAVKGLSIKRNGLSLIDNLSFVLEGPFFLAIVGNNGCGKTTFLKAILSQLPYQGEINIPSSTIGYIAQKSQLQFDVAIKDLVVMGAYSKKGVFDNYSIEDYQEVEKTLLRVGLKEKSDVSYLKLSGGEQQLVWLAQQLMSSPKLLLLDEPTASLDVKNKSLFFSHINELVEQGTQVICVTHDLFFLKKMRGFCINLSDENPQVHKLSSKLIDEVYEQMS